MATSGCDLLCICPHSDDAEIALGGTLRLMADRNRSAWVCDLTRGELASNATADERWREAQAASAVLGLAGRVQLSLPDGFVAAADRAQVVAVVAVLRLLRPRWVVTAPEARRHPDHVATPDLVRRAVFLARLAALPAATGDARWWPAAPVVAGDEPWVTEAVGHTCAADERPDLVFDVSGQWSAKTTALACFTSQFQRGDGRRATAINDPDFMVRLDDRARQWGRRVGVARGEALRMDAVPVADDLPPGRWA
jgi:bacillithiol biosynthesis deacetylase BshB1